MPNVQSWDSITFIAVNDVDCCLKLRRFKIVALLAEKRFFPGTGCFFKFNSALDQYCKLKNFLMKFQRYKRFSSIKNYRWKTQTTYNLFNFRPLIYLITQLLSIQFQRLHWYNINIHITYVYIKYNFTIGYRGESFF